MRFPTLALPILLLAAVPLAAQLTPDQRAAVERKPSAAKSTAFYNAIEQRALDGDPTAWFGAAAREDLRRTDEGRRLARRLDQPQGIRLAPGAFQGAYAFTASERHDHWFAIGQRATAPAQLRRAPPVDGPRFRGRDRIHGWLDEDGGGHPRSVWDLPDRGPGAPRRHL